MMTNLNQAFPGDDHGLGFELYQHWYMGALATPYTAGHTGFTGTSLVIDPTTDSFVILLTNHVHPNRNWGSTNPPRRAVADDVARAIAVHPAAGRDSWFGGMADASTATLTAPISLPSGRPAQLDFDLWYDTEPASDFLHLEGSRDGGSTWTAIPFALRGRGLDTTTDGSVSGYDGHEWLHASTDLAGWSGPVQLRWRYATDPLYHGRGVYVDGVRVAAGGAGALRRREGPGGVPGGRMDAERELSGGPDRVVVRIRALLPALAPAERRVGQVVLEDASAAALTIGELADRAGTSQTTVVRFCRQLGFPGYPQLRIALATEAGRLQGGDPTRVVGSDIGPDDDLASVVEKIAFADARAVEETAAQLDVTVLGQVVDAIVGASRTDIYGVGASAFVAADFQQKLHRIGQVAFAWSDVHVALTSAAVLGPGDVAIGISHTGSTQETIDALAEAARHDAVTVALTNAPRSAIARLADLTLTTAARETTYRSGATASRLAQLTVVDCVFVGVAQQTFGDTQAALEATREAVSVRRDRRRR